MPTRLMSAFKSVDMSKNFYFSYTYDITSILQANLTGAIRSGPSSKLYNDRFAWNHHMLSEFVRLEDGEMRKNFSHWVIPLMHGHVDQASRSVFGLCVKPLIRRRVDGSWSCNIHHSDCPSVAPFRGCTVLDSRCQ